MNQESEGSIPVSVRILDKEYQVACPASERTDLLDSAEILNEKMREIRDSGRIVGLDRIAVMARGELREIRPTADWTEEEVLQCAIAADEATENDSHL